MLENDLPEWAIKMTDEEWENWKKKEYCSSFNCAKCGKRLVLTICDDSQPNHYCIDCCPRHLWQTTYDWPVECALCGINYTKYLESILDKHGIEYNSDNWVEETEDDKSE
jgi:hypothetical protein